MPRHLLVASIVAIVLANMLVFGMVGTYVGTPTPRPTRAVEHKTFTPNPEYAKRMVTSTLTPSLTPTQRPTPESWRNPRGPRGYPDD